MHDPMTQAFQIKSPVPWGRRYDGRRNYPALITIWHNDPETDGTDDSCGWFCRARHGNKEKLKRIEREFEFACFSEHSGYFDKDGHPRYSPMAITFGLFKWASYVHFGTWRRADRFVRSHLADIMFFAENPVDSLFNAITNQYGVERKEYRVEHFASIIYGWILRAERRWYRHPRWHIHHWRIQVHPWQTLRRWLFERCSKCGKGYPWGYCPVGNWSGTETWHRECERPDAEAVQAVQNFFSPAA